MKKQSFVLALLFSLTCMFSLLGCEGNDNNGGNNQGDIDNALGKVQMKEQALSASDVPQASAEETKDFGVRLNGFGYDFYGKLNLSENAVFSPFSMHSALAMTSHGAQEATLKEMQSVLRLNDDMSKAAELNGKMRLKLRFDGQNQDSLLQIANRVWVENSLEVKKSFSDILENQYKAALQRVDFAKNSPKIVEIINQWVSANTNGMIKKLVNDNSVNANTRLVLVNAVYFEAKWVKSFERNNTKQQKFYLDESNQKDVSMMHQQGNFKYLKDDKYAGLVMPYKGDKFEMVFILPDSKTGLKEVMAGFNAESLSKLRVNAEMKDVSLYLPKFKVEQEIEAIPVLESLGMKAAFHDANFNGIVDNSALVITEVIQKAVIDVDEEGTKAAAATSVIVGETAIPPMGIEFKADHPFAYALVHSESGAILFMGHYVK